MGFAGLGSEGCSRVGSGVLPGSLGTSCGVRVGGCCAGAGFGLVPGWGTCCGFTGPGSGLVPGSMFIGLDASFIVDQFVTRTVRIECQKRKARSITFNKSIPRRMVPSLSGAI